MHWMRKWPGGFPVFVAEAKGARFVDVDGIEYVDFCLGDTGAMTGHAPDADAEGGDRPVSQGDHAHAPERGRAVGLGRADPPFGVSSWQFALTATDANRFTIRLARHLTGRSTILVFNWCYHGTVDETFATLGADGVVRARSGNLGPPVDPAVTTRVVEFNDLDALERELAHGDVALVLAEPALTNIGIVHPGAGLPRRAPRAHAAARHAARDRRDAHDLLRPWRVHAGARPRARRRHDRQADRRRHPRGRVRVLRGGRRASHGANRARGRRRRRRGRDAGRNALSLAAMRATLGEVLTEEAFARMIPLAERWTEGVEAGIAESGLPWHVTRLGCRAEYLFGPDRPRNGAEAHAASDAALERYMHLFALNRGILLTPFHNMALMSPATTEADVDRHTEVFREAVLELAS